jgi:hypothetical protein
MPPAMTLTNAPSPSSRSAWPEAALLPMDGFLDPDAVVTPGYSCTDSSRHGPREADRKADRAARLHHPAAPPATWSAACSPAPCPGPKPPARKTPPPSASRPGRPRSHQSPDPAGPPRQQAWPSEVTREAGMWPISTSATTWVPVGWLRLQSGGPAAIQHPSARQPRPASVGVVRPCIYAAKAVRSIDPWR